LFIFFRAAPAPDFRLLDYAMIILLVASLLTTDQTGDQQNTSRSLGRTNLRGRFAHLLHRALGAPVRQGRRFRPPGRPVEELDQVDDGDRGRLPDLDHAAEIAGGDQVWCDALDIGRFACGKAMRNFWL